MIQFNSVKKFADFMVAEKKISGCSLAICNDHETVFSYQTGYSDIKKKYKINDNSVFRLASMTKPITAMAVLLCIQEGKLDLNAKISDYIPEFKEMRVAKTMNKQTAAGEKAKQDITLLQLLTHSSGLGSGAIGREQFKYIKPQKGESLKIVSERYAKSLLEFEPGSAQSYSPIMAFDVCARLVEIVSGKSFDKFLTEKIFWPLGMRNTSYFPDYFPKENIVQMYLTLEDNGLPYEMMSGFDDFPYDFTGGGAGLMSDITDYMIFSQELLCAAKGKGKILSEDSLIKMKYPYLRKDMAGISDYYNRGLGVRVVGGQDKNHVLTPGSFGWSGAYGTHFWVDIKLNMACIYMHNSLTYGGAGAPHTVEFEKAVMEDLG